MRLNKKLILIFMSIVAILTFASCAAQEKVVEIMFTEEVYNLHVNEKKLLDVEIIPGSEYTEQEIRDEISFYSSNPEIAEIVDGKLIAKQYGTVEIKVEWNLKAIVFDRAMVHVGVESMPDLNIIGELSSYSMHKGTTSTLAVQEFEHVTVSWKALTPEIATLEGDQVTAIKAGKASFEATITDGVFTVVRTLLINVIETEYAINYVLNEEDAISEGVNALTNPTVYNTLDTEAITLAAPTREGATFVNWTIDGVVVTEIPTGLEHDIEVVANWEFVDYTITYEMNDGVNSDANPETLNIESKVTLAAPTRNGATFVNWTLNGTPVETLQSISENITLVANWNLIDYTITYDLNGGVNNTANVDKFTVVDEVTFADPSRTGYTFAGWVDSDDEPITGIEVGTYTNVTVKATWDVITYTISFEVPDDVDAIADITYNYDSETISLSKPERTGYKFEGWYISGQPTVVTSIPTHSTGDKVLYAEFTPIIYKLNYHLLGGTGATDTTYTIETSVVIPTEITRDGYTFSHFIDEEGTIVTEIPVGSYGDVNLTAVYDADEYNITYVLNGGTGVENTTYTIADAITLPDPTINGVPVKTGYYFYRWVDEDNNPVTSIPAGSTGHRTFTAKWIAYAYALTYELNGGTFAGEVKETYTIEDTIDLVKAEKNGYTFLGWKIDDAEPIFGLVAGTYYRPLTLVAQWEIKTYNISYTNVTEVEGVLPTDAKLTYTIEDDVEELKNLPTPTRNFYEFVEWQKDGVSFDTIDIENCADITLEAVWKANEYTLTFVLPEDVTPITPITFTVLDTVDLPTPERIGYSFDGWYETVYVDHNVPTEEEQLVEVFANRHGNITLTGKFSVANYEITYLNVEDAVHTNPETYTIESGVTLTPATRTGFEFVGWVNESGAPITAIDVNTYGARTITALWEPYSFDIEYVELNGGSFDTEYPTSFTFEERVVLVAPVRDGYVFKAFVGEGIVAEPIADSDRFNYVIPAGTLENITVTVEWNIRYYEINLDVNNGEALEDTLVSYTINSEVIELPTPEREGYTFKNWADGEGHEYIDKYTGVHKDLTLVAVWEAKTYKLTLNNEGAETYKEFTAESEAIVLDVLEKQGYVFDGWFTLEALGEGEKLVELPTGTIGDVTLYAHWSIIYYELYLLVDPGVTLAEDTISYTVEDWPVSLPTIERNGYEFTKWMDLDDNESYYFDAYNGELKDKTLYADTAPISYAIYYVDGPTTTFDYYTIESDTVILTTPEKLGYTFNGWYTSEVPSEGEKIEEIPTGSTGYVTVYAQWTPITYTITLDVDGGDPLTEDSISYTAEDWPVSLPDATKNGYQLVGWYSEGGINQNFCYKGDLKDITLYAVWVPEHYYVYYVDYDTSTFYDTFTIESDTLILEPLERIGYTFDGWYTSETPGDGVKVEEVPAGSTGDITVYAQWSLTTFKVVLDVDGGDPIPQTIIEFTVEDPVINLPTPTKAGYDFAGWWDGVSETYSDSFFGQPHDYNLVAFWMITLPIDF